MELTVLTVSVVPARIVAPFKDEAATQSACRSDYCNQFFSDHIGLNG
jgi:hypothetical protein